MADAATTTAAEQEITAQEAAPTPADVFGTNTAPATQTTAATVETPTITQDDLDAATAAKDEAVAKLDAVLTALGIKSADTDPAQVAADLTRVQAENAVLRAGTGIADVDALLDSRRFTDSLASGVDTTNMTAVKAHIEAFVKANPRYAPTTTRPAGVSDAAATGTGTTATGGDWLRQAINSR